MVWQRNESTIGTAVGRDYTTVAAWEADVDPGAGDGSVEVGTMYADSIFTEEGTVVSGQTVAEHTFMILRANEAQAYNGIQGDGVVMKPANGSTNVPIINWFSNYGIVYGIEFDGEAPGYLGSTNGLMNVGSQGERTSIVRCGAHGSRFGVATNGSGFRSFNTSSNYIYCIGYRNGKGIESQGSGTRIFCCGAYNNDVGFNGTFINNTCALWGSWSFLSGTNSVERAHWLDPTKGGFNVVDDTRFSDNSSTQYGNVESANINDANFVDPANGNFQVSAPGILQGIGPMKPPMTFRRSPGMDISDMMSGIFYNTDLLGRGIVIRPGDRFDVGPDQLSHAPDLTPPGKATNIEVLT
jgi:hypothetical protein